MQKNMLFRAVPSYPSALYSAKTLHDIYNVPDRNRLAGENKGTSIYRSKRRELQFPKRGFSHGSLYAA
jgi:hypothetical protein